MPLPVTYNMTMGVDKMEQPQKNITVEAQDPAALRQALKIGIYKSLCAQGLISSRCLMQLMQMQRGGKTCQ